MARKSKKSAVDNNKYNSYIIVVSTLLCGLFFYQLLVLIQNVKLGVLGAPNSIAAALSAVLAVYILINAKDRIYKYVAVAILAILATGVLIWLFGTTSVGVGLSSVPTL